MPRNVRIYINFRNYGILCKHSHNITNLTTDIVYELDAGVEIKTCRQEDGAGSLAIAVLHHISIGCSCKRQYSQQEL